MTKFRLQLQLATIAGFIRLIVGLLLSTSSSGAQPGKVDPSFVFQGGGVVSRIAVQRDDRIVFVSSNASRFFVGRSLENGDIDPSFDVGNGADNRIDCIAVHSDGRILAGGSFTNFGGATRERLARLLSDGRIDDSFTPRTDGRVADALFLEDGRSIIVGSFTNVNGVARSRIARLLPDGSLDASFQPSVSPDCWLNAVALQADGEVVAAGGIWGGSLAALYLVRIATNGQVSMSKVIGSWLSYPVPEVLSLAVQRDGRLLMGGTFTNVYGRAAWNLARLKADGSLDESFNPVVGANQRVTAIELQADDAIYLGGSFTSYAGVVRRGLTRLCRDGILDINYFPEDAAVFNGGGIALQSSGRLLASGALSTNRTGILRLFGYPDTPPVLLQSPTNVTVTAGTNAVFGVQVSSVRPLTYQWFHDGNAIAGVDSPFLVLTNVAPGDAGAYWAVVTNSLGSITSQVATLSVIAVAPAFVVQPADQSVPAGQGYSFSVIVTGIPQPRLQWYFNDTPIPGATYDSHGRYPATEAHAGEYTVVAGNIAGVVTSEVATLTVTFAPPEIVSQPLDLTVAEGRTAIFEISASGAPPPSFQWYFHGVPLAGQLGSRLVLTRVSSNNVGEYHAVAINSHGSVTSAVARLTMTGAPDGPGSVDLAFSVGANGVIRCMARDANGGLIIAGDFDRVGEFPRNKVARILADGTVDASFDSGAGRGRSVSSMAISPNGSIVLGGRYSMPGIVGYVDVIRLRPDGTIDSEFAPLNLVFQFQGDPGSSGFPSVIVQSSGHIIASTGPGNLSDIYRAHPSGLQIAEAFSYAAVPWRSPIQPSLGYYSVYALRDNKVLVDYAGRMVLRTTPDLGQDWRFTNSIRSAGFGRATAFFELPDGRVLLGGAFYGGTNGGDGGLIRLLSNGELDTSFRPVRSSFGRVYSIAHQDDGKLIIGGSFTNLGGVARSGVARLDAEGDLDVSFEPGSAIGAGGGAVRCITLLGDGRVAVAGGFYSFDDVACSNLVVLRGDPVGLPLIDKNPEARTVVAGRPASLHVFAGPAPVNFQWHRNGEAVPGATNLLIDIVRADVSAHAGEYKVVVSNDSGSVTSAPAVLTVTAASTDAGRVDATSISPEAGTDGFIYDAVRQPDGKLIIVGSFREAAGVARSGIARLHPNGECDESFDPGHGADGYITDVLLLPDGRVVAIGNFSSIDGIGRENVVRFNSDGSLDSTFNAGTAAEFFRLRGIASSHDGRVIVFGQFSQFAGVSCNGIVRLNDDGSVDLTFLPPYPGPTFNEMELMQDGSFLVATTSGVRRLLPDGTWDGRFSTATAGWIARAILPRPNGKIIVAGNLNPSNRVEGVARLLDSGAVDSTFIPLALTSGSSVNSVSADECGRLIVTGILLPTNSAAVHAVMRLLPDGRIDPAFQIVPIDYVVSRAIPMGDRMVLAGGFSEVDGVRCAGLAELHGGSGLPEFFTIPARQHSEAGGEVVFYVSFTQCNEPFVQWSRDGVPIPGATNLLYRINNATPSLTGMYTVTASNSAGAVTSAAARLTVRRAPLKPGSLDVGFYSGEGPNGSVTALDVDDEGRVVIAGDFTSVDGFRRPGVARMNADGGLDAVFNPGFGFTNRSSTLVSFSSVIARNDGKLIVGGAFTHFGNVPRLNLAQLNLDGSLDESFVPGIPAFWSGVTAMLLQPDGRVVVGADAQAVVRRLLPNGSIDPSFKWERTQGRVTCLAQYPDGRILLGGSFDSNGGIGQVQLFRVNSDGERDLTFNRFLGTDSPILSVQIDSRGRIVIGGDFTRVNGSIGRRVARLNDDGSLDASFQLDSGANFVVCALAVQGDGKTYIAGSFTNFNGVFRRRIARLLDNGGVDDSFDPGFGLDSQVQALKLDAFGMLCLGGRFTNYHTFPRPAVVRVIGEPRLANVRLDTDRLRARFLCLDGWTYHLEGGLQANGPDWTSLTNVAGRGQIQLFDTPVELALFRFYRMRIE